MHTAGNWMNHPESIGRDPHVSGSPLPKAGSRFAVAEPRTHQISVAIVTAALPPERVIAVGACTSVLAVPHVSGWVREGE